MLSKETIEKMRTLEAALYAAQDALCDEAERLTEALRSVGRGVAAQVDPEGVAVYPDPQDGAWIGWDSDGEKVFGEVWRDGPRELTVQVQRHHRITCRPTKENEGWAW